MKIPDAFDPRRLKAALSARSFEVSRITDTINSALASAGLNTQSGLMKGVLDTIKRALSSSGLTPGSAPVTGDDVIDVMAHEIAPTGPGREEPRAPAVESEERARPGPFVSRSFSNNAGTRSYKVYVPMSYRGHPLPLVVMLHGCTQSPDDFAAGTRMNEFAEEHGFLVVYPAQAANANRLNCWNWFKSEDQIRDLGEPSLIAGIAREVAVEYAVDERRIFVAGLSAGAAMAVILGETYPELFAAVGAHSGLPYGAAQGFPSALAAMNGGGPRAGTANLPGAGAGRRERASRQVPTIVFHGDRDTTVHARNGAEIVAQATGDRPDGPPLRAITQQGTEGGRGYSRTVYLDASERPIVEQWVLHGAGHAWSGGSTRGSFTDSIGPDASAEMIRFFYAQQRAGTA